MRFAIKRGIPPLGPLRDKSTSSLHSRHDGSESFGNDHFLVEQRNDSRIISGVDAAFHPFPDGVLWNAWIALAECWKMGIYCWTLLGNLYYWIGVN